MPADWRGQYFDGRRPIRYPAVVRFAATGLEIEVDGQASIAWPYGEILQSQGGYAREHVRLERIGNGSGSLVVEDASFVDDLRRAAPELAHRFQSPPPGALQWFLGALAATAVVALGFGLYVKGLPTLTGFIAARVPVSWEVRLGERIVDDLIPPARRCTDRPGMEAITQIVERLTATRRSPYTFRLIVADDRAVNAFAAPGGFVVLNRGLLEATRSSEELAGVVAHEIQHVLQRHATRSVLEHGSTGLLIAAVMGDPGGATTYGIEVAHVLGTLRYSRAHEEEADSEGMQMLLDAGIDPQGMIAFFGSLPDRRDMPTLSRYLSTHPTTQERIDRLRALARGRAAPSVKLLPEDDWDETKRFCRSSIPRTPRHGGQR